MIKKIFLVLLLCLTFLPLSPVLAIQSCACTIQISGGARVGQGAGVEIGPGCDINQTINFQLGNTYSAADVLDEISFFDCPFKEAADQFMNLGQSMEVTALNCLGANLIPSGSQQGFDYSISCSLSDEAGIEPGARGGGGGGNNANGGGNGAPNIKPYDPPPPVRLINPIGGTKENPEGTVDTRVIFGKAIKVTLQFLGTFTLAVFFYGGFLWLTSAGNSDRVQKGFHTMLYAVVGLFIIFGAYGILNTVISGLLSGGGGGSSGPIADGPVSDPDTAECYELDRSTCDAQSNRCKYVSFLMPDSKGFEECITKESLGGYCDTKLDECKSQFGEDNVPCEDEWNTCKNQ